MIIAALHPNTISNNNNKEREFLRSIWGTEEKRKKIICGFVNCGKFHAHVNHTSKTHMCQSGVHNWIGQHKLFGQLG